MDRKFRITGAQPGAALTVRVVTRAAEATLSGFEIEGEVKVLRARLTAASAATPEANDELCALLARVLNMPVEQVEVVAGAAKSEKVVSVTGISAVDLEARLSH